MTTPLFWTILYSVSIILFLVIGITVSSIRGNSVGFGISACVTIIFVLIFCIATPNFEQMIENDYYTMPERPKCIEAGNVSLGCKKDYIVWQKDSIAKRHKYDSVKVKLESLIIKTDTASAPVIKNDAYESDSVKSCIERCWKFSMNSDIKKCQDECFE